MLCDNNTVFLCVCMRIKCHNNYTVYDAIKKSKYKSFRWKNVSLFYISLYIYTVDVYKSIDDWFLAKKWGSFTENEHCCYGGYKWKYSDTSCDWW